MRFGLMVLICILLQACVTHAPRVTAPTYPRMMDDVQRGKESFDAGDFKTAFHQLLPVAIEGNPDAEYAVGYMYYYGFGVARDADAGEIWMQRAASQGNEPAQKALAMVH